MQFFESFAWHDLLLGPFSSLDIKKKKKSLIVPSAQQLSQHAGLNQLNHVLMDEHAQTLQFLSSNQATFYHFEKAHLQSRKRLGKFTVLCL